MLPPGTWLERFAYRMALRRSGWQDKYVQPTLLKAFAVAYPKASVVQIGANDGEMSDPLLRILLAYPWSAVLVEAVPSIYERLKARHEKRSRIKAVNVAVSDSNGDAKFFSLVNREGAIPLPPWATGLGSFSKEIIMRQQGMIENIGEYIQECNVECITYQTLCQRYDLDQIDLLQTDTEGHDAVILNQVSLNDRPPKLIIYEHHHLEENVDEELVVRLQAAGYETFKEGLDTICLKTRGEHQVQESVVAVWREMLAAVD